MRRRWCKVFPLGRQNAIGPMPVPGSVGNWQLMALRALDSKQFCESSHFWCHLLSMLLALYLLDEFFGRHSTMTQQLASEKSVFLEALEIDSEADRRRFLNQACHGDTSLRDKVQALLDAHARPQPLLDATSAS